MAGARVVAVLADDLIWATRLRDQVRAAGGEAVHLRDATSFASRLAGPDAADAAIVDLTARAYDGVAAVRQATTAGVPVIAVGQHDDHELRRRALEAGAERVYAYRKLFEDGQTTLAAWLARTQDRVP